jgi:uncharacterized protein YecT (DUF1311 family)
LRTLERDVGRTGLAALKAIGDRRRQQGFREYGNANGDDVKIVPRPSTALHALVSSLLVLAAPPVAATPLDIEDVYLACVEQPAYDAGGAMVGDCMIDQSAVLDLDIETALARAAKNCCSAADRDAIAASQSAWIDYRESYCTLIGNSPGNTGSWISAGACRLDLTQKRIESLVYVTDHAYAWCQGMKLLRIASHFGDPDGLAQSDEDSGLAWTPGETATGVCSTSRLTWTGGTRPSTSRRAAIATAALTAMTAFSCSREETMKARVTPSPICVPSKVKGRVLKSSDRFRLPQPRGLFSARPITSAG